MYTQDRVHAARGLVAHMIRSYAAPGAPVPPMPDAAPTALYRAMIRLGRPS
ncbi:hypothetical protein AB0N50_10740 [Streptomyces pharetrae]|uniref:hypothetical protein n=1 Tax=Streptomyces pharetrae TaxID=291370 RepID=UPI00345FA5A8